MATETEGGQALRAGKIACIGEVMIELVTHGDTADLNVAGDTYNTAVYLARLLGETDATISYVTALGTDRFSDRILQQARSHGLDTRFIMRHPDKMPGLYAIETDDAGERSFIYWRSDSAARTMFGPSSDVGLDVLDAFDLVFLSGITLAILPEPVRQALINRLHAFRQNGGLVAYDSNHRPRLWENPETARRINTQMWSLTDIALPSLDDEMDVFADVDETETVTRLRSLGLKAGALKRGGDGPLSLSAGDPPQSFPRVETIVDSTAAGDSFNAGYLAGWVLGGPSADAMRSGHRLASRVIRQRGAIVATDR